MAATSTPRSDLIDVLQSRGYLYQCTDLESLDALASERIVTAYCGYDATGDSLHIGNLLSIMMLRWLQQTGHRPIALVGGGTTKVGDPSGKEDKRQILDAATIGRNSKKISSTFEKFLHFGSGEQDAILVNNADWLDSLEYIPFLRDVGKHFTINRMLTMDSVKLRLDREQPFTFLEFNYMVLQSYDFVELYKRYGCQLQFGGSDQWGNIVNGVELGRRIHDVELYGLTCPLLTTSSGDKMGKTASGSVWLNEDRLSAYGYFQFWRNTEDPDVGRFLKLYTELPLDEIERLSELQGKEINESKKTLAFEATRLLHGKDAATAALKTAESTFESGGLGVNLPRIEVSAQELNTGVTLADLFTKTALCESKGEARRLIRGGGAKLNDHRIDDEAYIVKASDLQNGEAKLSAGKKRHAVIVIQE